MASPVTADPMSSDESGMRITIYMFFHNLGQTIIYEWLPGVAVFVLLMVVAWVIPKAIATIIRRIGIRPHYVKLFATLLHFALIVFALYCTLKILGFDLLEVLLTFGISSLGVSIALAPILGDYFAGIQIELYDIIEPNAVIMITGLKGIVKETGPVNIVLYNAESDTFHTIPNRTVISVEITHLAREEAAKIAGKPLTKNSYDSVRYKHRRDMFNASDMLGIDDGSNYEP